MLATWLPTQQRPECMALQEMQKPQQLSKSVQTGCASPT